MQYLGGEGKYVASGAYVNLACTVPTGATCAVISRVCNDDNGIFPVTFGGVAATYYNTYGLGWATNYYMPAADFASRTSDILTCATTVDPYGLAIAFLSAGDILPYYAYSNKNYSNQYVTLNTGPVPLVGADRSGFVSVRYRYGGWGGGGMDPGDTVFSQWEDMGVGIQTVTNTSEQIRYWQPATAGYGEHAMMGFYESVPLAGPGGPGNYRHNRMRRRWY